MSDHGALVLGLTCVFCSIAMSVVALRAITTVSPAKRSLTALEKITLRRMTGAASAGEVVESNPGGPMAALRRLAQRLSTERYSARLQLLMDKAGNSESWTADRVYAYKGFGLFACGVLGFLFGLRSGAAAIVFGALGAAVGFWLPDLLVYNAGLKRQEQIEKTLPDTLDMLTISVEAGLGFDAALAQVARNTDGPVAGEFVRVLQEMQIGKSRRDALRGLGERTTVPDLRIFSSAVVQADALGIPIAGVLREQAREMRVKRHQRAEEKAQKVSVKIMVPLVLCILPSLFVVVIGPGAISIVRLFTHK